MAKRLAVLFLGLLVGVPAGVGLDRFVLRPGPPAGQKAVLGEWIAENRDRITFRTDGTFARGKKLAWFAMNGEKPPPEEQMYLWTDGQFAWEDEVLVLTSPKSDPAKVRVVTTDTELTLKFPDGRVERYTRRN